MKVEPEMVRTFYEVEAERDHLERQIHTHLHLRLLKTRATSRATSSASSRTSSSSSGRTSPSSGRQKRIGLILCAEQNEAVARYSSLHEQEQLFAAKYVTYLPTVEALERELARD